MIFLKGLLSGVISENDEELDSSVIFMRLNHIERFNFEKLCSCFNRKQHELSWNKQATRIIDANLQKFCGSAIMQSRRINVAELKDYWSINVTMYIDSQLDSPWYNKNYILLSKIDTNGLSYIDEYLEMLKLSYKRSYGSMLNIIFKNTPLTCIKQVLFFYITCRFYLEFGGGISYTVGSAKYSWGAVNEMVCISNEIVLYKFSCIKLEYFKKEISFNETKYRAVSLVKDFLFYKEIWINRDNYSLIQLLREDFLNKEINQAVFHCLHWLEECSAIVNFSWLEQVKQSPELLSYLNEHAEKTTTENKAIIRSLIETQLSFLNNRVCFQYQLDNRTRIYVKNWPINYQLSREVRSSLFLTEDVCFQKLKNDYLWLLSTFNLKQTPRLAFFQNLNKDAKKAFIIFLNTFFKKKKDYALLLKEEAPFYELLLRYSTDTIFELELWCDFILKCSHGPNWQERFLAGIENIKQLISLKINNKETADFWLKKLNLNESELPQLLLLQSELIKLVNIKTITTKVFFNDASSNVFQLLLLKTGCTNVNILQMSNILNNETNYFNIYSFLEEKLNSLNYAIKLNYKTVKNLSMRFCYGLTIFGIIKCIDKYNTDVAWTALSREKQWALAKQINADFWAILKSNDVKIEQYLAGCKMFVKTHKQNSTWFSEYKLPIFTANPQKIDRALLRTKKKIYFQKLVKELRDSLELPQFLTLKKELDCEEQLLSKDSTVRRSKYLTFNKKLLARVSATVSNPYIEVLKKKIIRIDKKLLLNEKKWSRKTIWPLPFKKFLKIRLEKEQNELDMPALLRSISPDSNHATDASILFYIIEVAWMQRIPIFTIHDAIGSHVLYSLFFRILFKKINTRFIANFYKNSIFSKTAGLSPWLNEDLEQKIIESKTFFS